MGGSDSPPPPRTPLSLPLMQLLPAGNSRPSSPHLTPTHPTLDHSTSLRSHPPRTPPPSASTSGGCSRHPTGRALSASRAPCSTPARRCTASASRWVPPWPGNPMSPSGYGPHCPQKRPFRAWHLLPFTPPPSRTRAPDAPLPPQRGQAHMTAGRASREAVWRRLDEMAALGLPLYVTELSLFNRRARAPVSVRACACVRACVRVCECGECFVFVFFCICVRLHLVCAWLNACVRFNVVCRSARGTVPACA
jgi:hypothetical protein